MEKRWGSKSLSGMAVLVRSEQRYEGMICFIALIENYVLV